MAPTNSPTSAPVFQTRQWSNQAIDPTIGPVSAAGDSQGEETSAGVVASIVIGSVLLIIIIAFIVVKIRINSQIVTELRRQSETIPPNYEDVGPLQENSMYAAVDDATGVGNTSSYLEVYPDGDGDVFEDNQLPDEDLLECLTAASIAIQNSGALPADENNGVAFSEA